MNNLISCVDDLLKTNNLSVSVPTTKVISSYIENIIFNIVSISCIIALINNTKTINKSNVDIVNKYINDICTISPKMKGGMAVLPSEYFGFDSGRYSATNNSSDILGINFESGIMRPQIGGGVAKSNKSAYKTIINDVLKYYKIKASAVIIKCFISIIDEYVLCFIKKLKARKDKVTSAVVKKIIKENKAFDIFK